MKLDTSIADFLVARKIPCGILIYHINGRGWHSGEAMPQIVDGLLARGYRFVLLRDYLTAKRGR